MLVEIGAKKAMQWMLSQVIALSVRALIDSARR